MNISKSIVNEGNPKRSLTDIKSIILHHTGNNSDKNKEFLNKADYISAHYLIQNNGSIWQLMDLDVIAYHAGVSEWDTLEEKGNSLNWCTIGIEVVGSKDNFTVKQQEALYKLCDYLSKKFDVPNDLILRHKDVSPGRKIDPDDSCFQLWDNSFSKFKKDLATSTTEYDDSQSTYIKETNSEDMKLSERDYKKIFDEHFENPLLNDWDGDLPMSEGQTKAFGDILMKKFLNSEVLKDKILDIIKQANK